MPVLLREARNGERGWVAVFLRPHMPVGARRMLVGEMLAKRQKQAAALQYLAAFAPEPLEGPPAGGIGRSPVGLEQLFQDGELDRRDLGVIDEVFCAAGLHVLPKSLGGDQVPHLRAMQQLGYRGYVD